MAPYAETGESHQNEPNEDLHSITADEGEEIPQDDDLAMDSGGDDSEDPGPEVLETLQNDSIAHLASHTDSVYSIARHPTEPSIVATGGGDDTVHVFSLPSPSSSSSASSFSGNPPAPPQTITPHSTLKTHTDSVTALSFSLPDGSHLFSAGMDGRLCAYIQAPASSPPNYTLAASTREVDEITFLTPCPHPSHPSTVALGASDGSIWIHALDPSTSTLEIVNAYYLHTAPATSGAWDPSGSLLSTVSEDGSLYVWDVFGDAAASGASGPAAGAGVGGNTTQHVVGLTAADERFRVDGGLYSVAVAPSGAFATVGGAGGQIRIVGLPRLGSAEDATASVKGGAGARSKPGGGRHSAGPKGSVASAGQAGVILASLCAQAESVETIAFSSPGQGVELVAAGSVDGSFVVFDARRGFAVRRHVRNAHGGEAVIKVEFGSGGGSNATPHSSPWTLTTSGNDGILKRWDLRGSTAPTLPGTVGPSGGRIGSGPGSGASVANPNAASPSSQGLVGEWKGHRGGGGEGGGILGFVQAGRFIVTAGDDGVVLVFDVGAG